MFIVFQKGTGPSRFNGEAGFDREDRSFRDETENL
jgi:hypothetical protein